MADRTKEPRRRPPSKVYKAIKFPLYSCKPFEITNLRIHDNVNQNGLQVRKGCYYFPTDRQNTGQKKMTYSLNMVLKLANNNALSLQERKPFIQALRTGVRQNYLIK